jgi:hypothetical protein
MLEGYASLVSAVAGDWVDFHVRADAAHRHFAMDVFRRGRTDEPVAVATGDAFVPGAEDDASHAATGCGWPAVASCRTVIAPSWRSGYYVARLSSGNQTAWLPFVVRSASPGRDAPVLLKLSDTTAQAYNGWGDRSFYTTPHAPNISFDRPHADIDLFERYQRPFFAWAESQGIALDYCSSVDLHLHPRILEPYRLLVSIGHDEYWSLEMRDQVEAFIAAGGNVAFFSANTCYWQARIDFGNGRRIMTCYKETEGKPPDPQRDDPRRVTVRWYEDPVLRPETALTGVSYRYGAGWWIDPLGPARFRGYTVRESANWIFAGTGLNDGDLFGAGTTVDDAILGYETDAPGAGTPTNFSVLADADLNDWQTHGQGGGAALGVYERNGTVFTAGTVNWAGGLGAAGMTTPVDRITVNVLRSLSESRPALAVPNTGFTSWSGDAPEGWVLDGAGTLSAAAIDADDRLRFIDPAARSVRLDAGAGDTWLSSGLPPLDGATEYGAGCWMKSDSAGATIRLQTTDTWTDFATAEHSGSGEWELVWATGTPDRDQTDVPARVKVQLAQGASADFTCIVVRPGR